jgi:hypothetical protein
VLVLLKIALFNCFFACAADEKLHIYSNLDELFKKHEQAINPDAGSGAREFMQRNAWSYVADLIGKLRFWSMIVQRVRNAPISIAPPNGQSSFKNSTFDSKSVRKILPKKVIKWLMTLSKEFGKLKPKLRRS